MNLTNAPIPMINNDPPIIIKKGERTYQKLKPKISFRNKIVIDNVAASFMFYNLTLTIL